MLLLLSTLTASAQDKIGSKDFEQLRKYMTGYFHSGAQASADSNFFAISLHMAPLKTDKRSFWLYVEQAMSKTPEKPYRQRLYHVVQASDTTVVSQVLELKTPAAFIGAFKAPEMQEQLRGIITAYEKNPADTQLVNRQGCAIVLKRQGNQFVGETNGRECISTLRGAAYATSEARINSGGLITLDRGWSAEGKQVWGSTHGGYQFKRIDE